MLLGRGGALAPSLLLLLALLVLGGGKDENCVPDPPVELHLNLSSASGLYQIGLRYEMLGLYIDAIASMQKALDLDPGSPNLTTSLGRLQSIHSCGSRRGHPLHPPMCSDRAQSAYANSGQDAAASTMGQEVRMEGGFRVMSAAYGLCEVLLAAAPEDEVGTLFTRGRPWASKHVRNTEDEVDFVVVDGCGQHARRAEARYWHTLGVASLDGLWSGEELLSWVEGDDPWVTARLFLRHSDITDQSVMRPIWALVAQRQSALRNATLDDGAPPWDIPPGMLEDFTMQGRVDVGKHYVDESSRVAMGNYEFGRYKKGRREIDDMVAAAKRRETRYYHDTDAYLFAALDAFGGLEGRDVVIMGSLEPWYESVCLANSARTCSTIEYNRLEFDHPQLASYTVDEYGKMESKPRFDVALSVSSFEHDGLGRYGDDIDVNGDIKAMERMKRVLEPGGLLFIAVPMGRDLVYWNAHRKYGRVRLPLLFRGWTVLRQFGLTAQLLDDERHTNHVQPVWVLRNESPGTDSIDWDEMLRQ